jgi:hypothetical protein
MMGIAGRVAAIQGWAGSRGRLGGRGNAVDKDENDESAETRFREYQRSVEAIDRTVANLQPAYIQALNSIWIANAGASLATLSFIGATFHKSGPRLILLSTLGCFVLGLISMGAGILGWLIKERRWLAYIVKHEPPLATLDVPANLAKSPTEQAGLRLKDPRTTSALISGALFVFGCVTGLFALLLG